MGMFDDVIYKCECPVCNEVVKGFQSKDGDCCLNKIAPSMVDNFYSNCDSCDTWFEFNRVGDAKFKMTLHEDYPSTRYNVIDEHTKEIAITN